jgi:hypothetical protein
MMDRFILRYKGLGKAPSQEINQIKAHDGLLVIDAAQRMLLVESSQPVIQGLLKDLNDWIVMEGEENRTPLPDTRQKINH